jgi:hypothetical protein
LHGAHLSCHRMKLGFLQPPTSAFDLPITFFYPNKARQTGVLKRTGLLPLGFYCLTKTLLSLSWVVSKRRAIIPYSAFSTFHTNYIIFPKILKSFFLFFSFLFFSFFPPKELNFMKEIRQSFENISRVFNFSTWNFQN